MTLTFVDSGVLIAAARGTSTVSAAAMGILGDPNRQFVASDFVRLEVLPKPTYYKRAAEVAFYRTYFDAVTLWVPASGQLVRLALTLANAFGLSAIDARHIAAAEIAHADEFVTSEKSDKPFFRVTTLRIVIIHP